MLTLGLIFLLWPPYLVKSQKDIQKSESLLFVKQGDSVNITCIYESDMAMHFSWYKHRLGQKPRLISNFYKYDKKATFHHEFKGDTRFSMVNEKGITHLEINELRISDTATYYCGSAHSNIVEFGEGTQLIVQAAQLSVLQQPVPDPIHPGASVTLQCTVIADRCAENHSVYWFRHNSKESQPGIMYTYGDSKSWCNKNPVAGSSTKTCIYSLPTMNFSLSNAGTYYCAVIACGEILFGNGTRLDMNITGPGCSEHIHFLVLFSIIRFCALLCCVVIATIFFFRSKTAKYSVRINTSKKKQKSCSDRKRKDDY